MHDFTFRKQYGDKTKSAKNIMKFTIFIPPGTVKISCFQKEIRGKRVVVQETWVFDKVNVFHVFRKRIELNPIICERVTNNKVQIFP